MRSKQVQRTNGLLFFLFLCTVSLCCLRGLRQSSELKFVHERLRQTDHTSQTQTQSQICKYQKASESEIDRLLCEGPKSTPLPKIDVSKVDRLSKFQLILNEPKFSNMERSCVAPPPRLVSNLMWRKHVSSTVVMATMATVICCGLIMRIDRRDFRTVLASELHKKMGNSLWQSLPPSVLRAAERKFEQGFTDGELLTSKTQPIIPEVGAQQPSVTSPGYATRQNAVATAWSPIDSTKVQRELALARLFKKASSQAAAETHLNEEIEPRMQEYVSVPARVSVRSRSYAMPELSQLLKSEHADKNVQIEAEEAHKVKSRQL
jgi:hypothetical protein